ncbi:MAG TPA: SBBP repeat-containing protein, partial [Verrucomicrobiae bacterium]|nr:SBBP repeat-containing protein [Verrucomicrobiae bacterium]
DGPAGSFDQPVDLAVDSSGGVYVTGISTLNGLNTDFATLKYDTNGVEVWTARYNGPANIEDAPVRLGLDGAGNIYVGGWSLGSNGVPDYALVKYTPGGQRTWAARFDGLAARYDYLSDMIVDPSGNVYVTGSSDTFAGDADWVTLKFNPNGGRVWLATYGGSFGVGDNPAFLAFDSSGNVCLSGALYTGESYGVATACYDVNGNRRWTALYGGDTHANEFAAAIVTDPFGGVVVGGASVITNFSQSFLLKYAQSNVVGAPIITMPPAGSIVAANESATLSVSAQGEGPLNYQWLRGRTMVPGASQTNLVINGATDLIAGYYSAEVQNHLGLVVSPAAELRVRGPVVPQLSGELSNGMLRIFLLGEAGFNYRVEASSDLITWELVSINYNQNSSIVITEPLSAARRYYRAVKLP